MKRQIVQSSASGSSTSEQLRQQVHFLIRNLDESCDTNRMLKMQMMRNCITRTLHSQLDDFEMEDGAASGSHGSQSLDENRIE